MSFSTWSKKTKCFEKYMASGYRAMAMKIAEIAYKAGERDGRKTAEMWAKKAIEFRGYLKEEDFWG